MSRFPRTLFALTGLTLFLALVTLSQGPIPARAQDDEMPQLPRDAQQGPLNQVRFEADALLKLTVTAQRYSDTAYDTVGQQFERLRFAFGALARTLTPAQLDAGANDLAELDAGLGTIGQAFAAYQDDLAQGRALRAAVQDLCAMLRDGTRFWLGEFNRDCARLKIGWR